MERRAKRFLLPVCDSLYRMIVAIYHLPFARSLMPSTQLDLFGENHRPLSSGKTSPEFSAPKIMPSDAFWQDLPAKMSHFSQQGAGGRTLVVCLAPKEQLRGGFSTPNISAWPNAAVVCSLSQVLERGLIPQQFFLSSRACAGILRRAEKRGKSLPRSLAEALLAVASAPTSTLTEE